MLKPTLTVPKIQHFHLKIKVKNYLQKMKKMYSSIDSFTEQNRK